MKLIWKAFDVASNDYYVIHFLHRFQKDRIEFTSFYVAAASFFFLLFLYFNGMPSFRSNVINITNINESRKYSL